MGMIRAIRMLNGLVDGTITAAQLETMLTTGGRSGDFTQLLSVPSLVAIIANSSPALEAVMTGAGASAKARSMIFEAASAYKLIMANSSAVGRIIASVSALTAIGSNTEAAKGAVAGDLFAKIAETSVATKAFLGGIGSAARRAVYESDKALEVIFNSLPARTGMRDLTGFSVKMAVSGPPAYFNNITVNTIIFGIGMDYNNNHTLNIENVSASCRVGTKLTGITPVILTNNAGIGSNSDARYPLVLPAIGTAAAVAVRNGANVGGGWNLYLSTLMV